MKRSIPISYLSLLVACLSPLPGLSLCARMSTIKRRCKTLSSVERDFYDFDGRRCSYLRSRGSLSNKPTLLLIHPIGIGIDSWFWRRFVRAWELHPEGGGEVLIPDLLGCGESARWDPIKDPLSVPIDFVRQCEALLRDHGCENVVVVTQGGVAPIGIQMAARNEAGVIKKMALFTPPLYNDLCKSLPQNEVDLNLFLLRALPKLVYDALCSRPSVKFFSEAFLFYDGKCDDEWLDNAISASKDYSSRHSIWTFNAGCFNALDYTGILSKIVVQPTLVVYGQGNLEGNDEVSTDVEMELNTFRMSMPSTQGTTVASGKNVLPWQNPEDACNVLAEFIRDNTPREGESAGGQQGKTGNVELNGKISAFDWSVMTKDNNYLWYRNLGRDAEKKKSADDSRSTNEVRVRLSNPITIAGLLFFVPLFSAEFFFAISRQFLCGSDWSKAICDAYVPPTI